MWRTRLLADELARWPGGLVYTGRFGMNLSDLVVGAFAMVDDGTGGK